MGFVLPGLAFFVAALATVALGAIGLVVQSVVVGARAWARPKARPSWGRGAALALVAPGSVVALGAISAWIGEFGPLSLETERMLDSIAFGLPLGAVALWIAVQVRLVRGGVGD
jgi:hypothetical protein